MAGSTKKSRNNSAPSAAKLTGHVGRTIHRLRKSYSLSLSELSEQSGVAKSIISQIERNETNPTLSTIWRLSQALDISIERVLAETEDTPFIDYVTNKDVPFLKSEDDRVDLAILGWTKTVEWLQWYQLSATEGGVLGSEGHQRGSVESLSVTSGEFEVEIRGQTHRVKAGESLRYRCDMEHLVTAVAPGKSEAFMVCILKAAVMD